jgi:hypothetical protein
VSFPSQPIGATGFTDPFIDLPTYQQLTGDLALTEDQLDFLAPQCELILATYCEATWRYGQYAEILKIYQNGFVYPSATPIDVTKPINGSDGGFLWNPVEAGGTDVMQAGSPIQGVGIMVGPWGMFDPSIVWGSYVPNQMQLTYWGGWDDTSSDTRGDVWIFKRCLAKMVRYGSQPQFATTGGIGGVTSMSIGGISISGSGLSAMMLMDDGMYDDVVSLKRANVGGWQI